MARPYTDGEKAPTKATDAPLRTSALASVTKPNPPDVPFYLTIADAARLLQSGTRPLYRAAKAGRLRVAKINDRGDLSCALRARGWKHTSTAARDDLHKSKR